MSLKLLVKKLGLKEDKFITRAELRLYCKELKLDYFAAVGYLMTNGYLVRLLRGIFYIRSIEEKKLDKISLDHLTIIKRALEIKGIKNWYFGLETAIKLNKITHEYFTVDYVINDKLTRPRPIEILKHRIKFIKLNKKLFGFGIVKDSIPYSDIEKTTLDMIHLAKYNDLSDKEIKDKVIDLISRCSRKKLGKYAKHYPKTVKKLAREMLC